MKTNLRLIVVLFAIAVGSAFPATAQVYLVSGSPTPKSSERFAVVLSRVEGGAVNEIEEAVPQKAGAHWIEISYDARKLAIITSLDGWHPGGVVSDIIVDLDKAAVVKRCNRPFNVGTNYTPIMQWMADVPVSGLSSVVRLVGGRNENILQGMRMDPNVPCEQSYYQIQPADNKNILLSGQVGVADVANELVDIGMDEDGSTRQGIGSTRVYTGRKVPQVIRAGLNVERSTEAVNNSQITLVFLSGHGQQRLAVLRKADQSWHRIPPGRERDAYVRAFGSFLAFQEVGEKTAQLKESAGRAEWRQRSSRTGPETGGSFRGFEQDRGRVYAGKLHLYDVDTERTYTIVTNQGDSEVILVENSVVYYRVSDRLYSATIDGDKLGDPQLLATSDLIRDAHWAFIPHR